jgi:hypothetical protein
MANYCVNKNAQSTGEHEVHRQGCYRMPDIENRIPLGNHASCHTALVKAQIFYSNVDGCFYCSNPCHTK